LILGASLWTGVLPACSEKNAQKQSTSTRLNPGEFEIGRWAATASVPGGKIRFHIDLTRADDIGYGAVLVNGKERIPIGEVTAEGSSIRLFLPAFNSRIEAELVDGVLEGNLVLTKRGDVEQTLPFRAEYAQGYTFSIGGDEPEIDVTGRWDVTFTQEDGEEAKAIGEFYQDGDKLNGTFLKPTGDYRYLSGTVTGRSFELSCFDGSHAFLFKAALTQDGAIDGDYWSGTHWHERWTARRDDDAALPDPYQLTWLEKGHDRIEFEFRALDGETVSLDDKQFENKVVIVVLAGSWCPNCHDEAAFLAEYYNENKDRGVEIIGLMYEHSRGKTAAFRQIERFQKKHKLNYTLLYAGYSDKEEAHKTLPMLNHVLAYPTTIFVDRTGKVARIHTGFAGPGTGSHYEAFKQEFGDYVDTLLAQ
jgi:peroxiredoxin